MCVLRRGCGVLVSKLAHSNQEAMDKIERDTTERDANTFAMHLLIPEEFLVKELEKLKPFDIENGYPIKDLARKFKVSESLMIARLAGRK